MNAQKRHEIFARLQAENPHPTTELNWNTPFELLAAVLLSAQATDVGVNKATARLYPVANTPQAIIDLGIDELKAHIKTIGLYNTKAENLMKTCHILVNQHGGEVPDTRQALEALPGVGRKTANVILNTAFGQPPWRWIRIFSGYPIAPASLKAKMSLRWSKNCCAMCQKGFCTMLTTG